MATESIDKLARRLAASVPEGLRGVRNDLEQNFRSILHSGLSRLNLVTREEFDVQQAVLARTREKLERLEQRLASLEAEPVTKRATKKSGNAGKGAESEVKPD
jgi:ubiquinone biosynthesis accessory factor UbiK